MLMFAATAEAVVEVSEHSLGEGACHPYNSHEGAYLGLRRLIIGAFIEVDREEILPEEKVEHEDHPYY